ncbi:MAG: amidohydrolase [Prevotella sp.]|jgi:amidohydrolase|nr:amidohydrolase [Prevotella sp.]
MFETEKKILEVIDKKQKEIIAFAQDIFEHPELGFKEWRTSAKVEGVFKQLSLTVKKGLAITGVKGYLREPSPDDINVAIIGELDAVKSLEHPFADPKTGAAHCCGHHAQLGVLFGTALALSEPDVAAHLDGNVTFFAVPSEEYGEIAFKKELREQGKIKFFGGKSELIAIGAFDDIDVALGYHTNFGDSSYDVFIGGGTSNGFIAKLVRYIGMESHAAASPQTGINALNAATIGLTALSFQRETFRDDDMVRIHPIMTRGGDLVNVIPGEAVIELLVRARNIPAILDANKKATRAFKAGADALGAKVEITDIPGYLPVLPELSPSPFLDPARRIYQPEKIYEREPNFASAVSSDMGDLSHLLPVFSFMTSGIEGGAHESNVKVTDPYKAYILPSKIMALSVYRLLRDQANAAKNICNRHKPHFTKQEYIDFLQSIAKGEEAM